MKLNFSLTGKTALVTGGGGVICSVISHALASQGANVAVCDLSEERATAVAEEIRSEGGPGHGYQGGCFGQNERRSLCRRCAGSLGRD